MPMPGAHAQNMGFPWRQLGISIFQSSQGVPTWGQGREASDEGLSDRGPGLPRKPVSGRAGRALKQVVAPGAKETAT